MSAAPFPRRPSSRSNDGCLPAVLLLASIVALSVIHGATLMKLWQWFIAEPFDVQTLGLAHAIGMTSIATALTISPRDSEDGGDLWDALVKVWVWRLSISAMLLGEGWVLSGWVS